MHMSTAPNFYGQHVQPHGQLHPNLINRPQMGLHDAYTYNNFNHGHIMLNNSWPFTQVNGECNQHYIDQNNQHNRQHQELNSKVDTWAEYLKWQKFREFKSVENINQRNGHSGGKIHNVDMEDNYDQIWLGNLEAEMNNFKESPQINRSNIKNHVNLEEDTNISHIQSQENIESKPLSNGDSKSTSEYTGWLPLKTNKDTREARTCDSQNDWSYCSFLKSPFPPKKKLSFNVFENDVLADLKLEQAFSNWKIE